MITLSDFGESIIMKILVLFSTVWLAMMLAGCSTTSGSFAQQTHFSFPNSNIKSLGNVKHTVSDCTFFMQPSFGAKEAKQLLRDAIATKPGASMLINYQIDTTVTTYPIIPYFCSETTISGEAVGMEVGEQRFKELMKKADY